ncbi:MAG: rod-binding protein [Spirochaetota bacterium]
MDIVNNNPAMNFDYSDINTKNKLDNINSITNNIKGKSQELNAGKFKEILRDVEKDKSYGGKFVGKDKYLVPRNIEEEKLLDAVTELESMFVNQMYKSMRSTLSKENDLLYGGMTEEVFTDMLYNEYSLTTSKNNNLGLAKQMYEQMLPQVRGRVRTDSFDTSA